MSFERSIHAISDDKIASSSGFDSPCFPKISFDVAEIYHWRWLEESGQWLENDDRTHLVLSSGKPVLKKTMIFNYHSVFE